MNTTTLQAPVNAIKYGTPGGGRTRDLRIKSPLLYQLSYGSRWCARQDSNLQPKDYESPAPPLSYRRTGTGGGIRTLMETSRGF